MNDTRKPQRGAKRLATAEQIGPVLDQEALAEREQSLVEIARIEAAYGDGRDLVNQILGQVQTADAGEQFFRTVRTSKIAFIKKNKLYRDIAGMKTPDGPGKLTGTWEDFCALLGRSVDQVNEDIANLSAFGEQALESMSRMGIGYRDLRQLRRLPDDSQIALIEAATAGDKAELLDLAEQLIARQKAEKDTLAAERDKAVKTASAAESDLEHANAEIAETKRRLNAANRRWAKADPDDVGKSMVLQLTGTVHNVCKELQDMRTGVDALIEHGETNGIDYSEPLNYRMAEVISVMMDTVQRLQLGGIGKPMETLRLVVSEPRS